VIGAQLPEFARFGGGNDLNQLVQFVCACRPTHANTVHDTFHITGDPLADFPPFLTRLFERYPTCEQETFWSMREYRCCAWIRLFQSGEGLAAHRDRFDCHEESPGEAHVDLLGSDVAVARLQTVRGDAGNDGQGEVQLAGA
jgi:hypothetical protein